MNRVEVSGALTRDPEQRFTQNDNAFVQASLAVNDTRWNPDTRQREVTTTYVTVQLWGYLAERLIAEAIGKGDEIYVLGTLELHEFETRGGEKVKHTRVVAMVWSIVRRKAKSLEQKWAGTDAPF